MGHNFSELGNQLSDLTTNMLYSLVGDERYEVLSWDIDQKGPFSLESLLVDQGVLRVMSEEKLLQLSEQDITSYAKKVYNFWKLIRDRYNPIQLYSYQFPQLSERLFGGMPPIESKEIEPFGVPLILFQTQENFWGATMLKQGYRRENNPKVSISATHSLDSWEGIDSLLGELEFPEWQNSWKLTSTWKLVGSEQREEILAQLLMEGNYLQIRALNEFLRLENRMEDYVEGDELPDEKMIHDFFEQNFESHQVIELDYNIGGESWMVHYAMGRLENQNALGLKTVSFTF